MEKLNRSFKSDILYTHIANISVTVTFVFDFLVTTHKTNTGGHISDERIALTL